MVMYVLVCLYIGGGGVMCCFGGGVCVDNVCVGVEFVDVVE